MWEGGGSSGRTNHEPQRQPKVESQLCRSQLPAINHLPTYSASRLTTSLSSAPDLIVNPRP